MAARQTLDSKKHRRHDSRDDDHHMSSDNNNNGDNDNNNDDDEMHRGEEEEDDTGGFVRPPRESGLFSPASSIASSTMATSSEALPRRARGQKLPTPRATPLKAGGSKESMLRVFLDRRIRAVQRRGTLPSKTVMAVGDDEFGDEAMLVEAEEHGPDIGVGVGDKYGDAGYTSYAQLAQDLDKLVDVLWFSGTPALQVQYLLSIALHAVNYIPSYPAAPKAMFRILDKLDIAFASLIKGVDIERGAPLPGMSPGRPALSMTDKVRLRGLVEKTRIIVTNAMMAADEETEAEDDDDDDDHNEWQLAEQEQSSSIDKEPREGPIVEMGEGEEDELDEDLDDVGEFDMRIGQVYERTLSLLGGTMVNTPPSSQ